MRGEHMLTHANGISRRGSSPHARGTHGVSIISRATLGIIPACAGNTTALVVVSGGVGDHPRMRGEHIVKHDRPCPKRGSSPHARGTPRHPRWHPTTPGIIPACAGNTWVMTSWTAPPRDHPRMRGEHVANNRRTNTTTGSSPHARGTLLIRFELGCREGIIPACAGNTCIIIAGQRPVRDHPRMRGEHRCCR